MAVNGSKAFESPRACCALVLCREQTTVEDHNLLRVIDFFGIPRKTALVDHGRVEQPREPYAIIASADCLAAAIEPKRHAQALPLWIAQASAAYVYGFQCNDRSNKLLQFLTGDSQAAITLLQSTQTSMAITDDFPEMCGPMSGLRVPVSVQTAGGVCESVSGIAGFRSIIRAEQGEVFFATTFAGLPFFLSTWGTTVDIGARSDRYFDVKTNFPEAVPPVFYLQWAFQGIACSPHQTNACLIVDDPPLKRRYGFLDYGEALELMRRHNFTTTIAFIPWNWRRTDAQTLSIFQNEPSRFSLVVHGCDHTTSEFSTKSTSLLNYRIQTSRERMELLRRRTWIKADPIMVFPQGKFSAEAGRVLKLNNFSAAVNTEVAPALPADNQTTIADLWRVAITKYGTFPIFTRRYPAHGIENFAFDALLGKPCLIAAHHDLFKNHARDLINFVTSLNSLKWNLVWRPLGEALRRSFRILLHEGSSVIEMFASSSVLENPFTYASKTLLVKQECDPDCVEAVLINRRRVEFNVESGYLKLMLTMFPKQTVRIRVVYRNHAEAIRVPTNSAGWIRVATKRYLSEFRDNYLSRSEFLYDSASRIQRMTKRFSGAPADE